MRQPIPIEELKRVLGVVEGVANSIKADIDEEAFESLGWLGNKDLEKELVLELDQIRAELQERRINAIATLIKVALDFLNYEYVDLERDYPKETGELYEELGFKEWMHDECIHFGFAKVTDGTALIYTCSDKPPFKLEVAVSEKTSE